MCEAHELFCSLMRTGNCNISVLVAVCTTSYAADVAWSDWFLCAPHMLHNAISC